MKTSALAERPRPKTRRRATLPEPLLACAGFALLVFLFYPGLFTGQVAALSGDHWEQHYPWTAWLADSLKRGTLPFWTPLIHCGFPIAAEGQVGAFYPPNLILCALLPARWAYAYLSVVHFLAAVLGTYLYMRRMGLSPLPSAVGASTFLFGAACGGAFYNITSLKTIAWFPWALAAFESFRREGRRRSLAVLAACLGLSLLAGYLQIALFSLGIFLVYAGTRIFWLRASPPPAGSRAQQSLGLAAAVLGAFVLAAPQLALTWQLAALSNRPHLEESYAYVGSLSPVALFTVFFPHWQAFLRGNCLYGGAFAAFLAGCAFFSTDERLRSLRRTWLAVGIIALLLALGRWSPLYVALVKLTHFYAFRVPAKFLVFAYFAFSVWAGIGLEWLLASATPRAGILRAARRFGAAALIATLSAGALAAAVTWLRPASAALGRWVLRSFVFGREGHPLTLAEYDHKLSLFLDAVRDTVGWAHPWTWLSLAFLAASSLAAFALARARDRRRWLAAALAFLSLDLYAYASLDMRKDFGRYDSMPAASGVLDRLRQDRAAGRLVRLHGVRRPDEPLPLTPSANMLESIPDIGAYSPLVLRRYVQTIGRLGNVNDSTTSASPSAAFLTERLPLLSFLGVSHILSAQPLAHRDLTLITQDGPQGPFLYENQRPRAVAHVVSNVETLESWEAMAGKLLGPGFDPRRLALVERSERVHLPDPAGGGLPEPPAEILALEQADGAHVWQVDTRGPGLFVVAETAYPGWMATVNGEPARLIPAYGLFQSVWLRGEGTWRVAFRFAPFSAGSWNLSRKTRDRKSAA